METSSIKTPFPGRVSVPSSFVSLFIFYILSYLPSKTIGCFSGHLMSSASDQKLFCEICSAFNCSFGEFVGKKVVSPSYSLAILAPPPWSVPLNSLKITLNSLLVCLVVEKVLLIHFLLKVRCFASLKFLYIIFCSLNIAMPR